MQGHGVKGRMMPSYDSQASDGAVLANWEDLSFRRNNEFFPPGFASSESCGALRRAVQDPEATQGNGGKSGL